jgi:hypothetical protein
MADLKYFQDEVAPHIGDLVIDDSWDVVRILGVVDGEDDYYYIYKVPHKGVVWSTCVGTFIPLKGKIDEYKYHNMNVCFYMNEPYWKDFDPIRDATPEEFKKYKHKSQPENE